MKTATVFRCEHDINQLVTCHNIKTGFLQGDSNAHRFEIEVVDDMNPVDLSGKTVICDVLIDSPQSPKLVPVPGTISGNLVTVILPGACYAIPARINIAVRLVDGEDSQNRVTILWASAVVVKSKASTVIDPGNVVPDLTTLLAQIDRMKQATADAEKVAQNVDGMISAAVDPVADDVDNLKDDVVDLKTVVGLDTKVTYDLSKYGSILGIVSNTGTWVNISSDVMVLITDIPSRLSVTAKNAACYVAFFNSVPSQPTASGAAVTNLCSGESDRHTIAADETVELDVPDDCKCIGIMTKVQGSDRTPKSVIGSVSGTGLVEVVDSLIERVDQKQDRLVVELWNGFEVTGQGLDADGKPTTLATLGYSYKIPVESGTTYRIKYNRNYKANDRLHEYSADGSRINGIVIRDVNAALGEVDKEYSPSENTMFIRLSFGKDNTDISIKDELNVDRHSFFIDEHSDYVPFDPMILDESDQDTVEVAEKSDLEKLLPKIDFKNLWSGFEEVGYGIDTNGNKSSYVQYLAYSFMIPVKQGTDYAIIYNRGFDANNRLHEYRADGTWIRSVAQLSSQGNGLGKVEYIYEPSGDASFIRLSVSRYDTDFVVGNARYAFEDSFCIDRNGEYKPLKAAMDKRLHNYIGQFDEEESRERFRIAMKEKAYQMKFNPNSQVGCGAGHSGIPEKNTRLASWLDPFDMIKVLCNAMGYIELANLWGVTNRYVKVGDNSELHIESTTWNSPYISQLSDYYTPIAFKTGSGNQTNLVCACTSPELDGRILVGVISRNSTADSAEANRYALMKLMMDIGKARMADRNADVTEIENRMDSMQLVCGAVVLLPNCPASLLNRVDLKADVYTNLYAYTKGGTLIHTYSMIKLLCATTALDYIESLEDVVEITQNDISESVGGSALIFKAGQRVTYRDLIYALLLPSSNQAGYALERCVGSKLLGVYGAQSTISELR